MAKSINLHKSREVSAAVKAIDGLTCPLLMPGTGGSIRRRDDIGRVGIPTTIATIDHVLDLQQQMLAIGHSFAQFLAEHPEAPGIVPQDFAHGSSERKVLVYVQANIAGDESVDAGHDALFDAINDALPSLFEDEHHEAHLTKAEALRLLANAQSNIDGLIKIRDLLAPLMDGAPAPLLPRAVDNLKVKLGHWEPNEIVVGDRLRKELKEDAISDLMKSIQRIGMHTPPTVRIEVDDEGFENAILVAGLHRVEACKRLGMKSIECKEFRGSETEARKWEIAENLFRAELTVQERAEHFAEWVRLTAEEHPQVGDVSGGRGRKGGISEAARVLPVAGETEKAKQHAIERALKIASITPAAKEAAAAAGLANNQAALLTVAKAEPEQQMQAVDMLVQAQQAVARRRRLQKKHTDDRVQCEVNQLMVAWNLAGDEARKLFLDRIGHAPRSEWHTTSDAVH